MKEWTETKVKTIILNEIKPLIIRNPDIRVWGGTAVDIALRNKVEDLFNKLSPYFELR